MDVNKTEAVTPVGSGGPKKEEKRGADEEQQENGQDAEAGASGGSPWEGTEAFAVGGLLAGALTPEVQKAFDSLARQIEPLRAEVEHAKGREAHFKELAEKHSFLPVPGRREFSRELTHVLSNKEHLTPPPSLVVLHLVNGDDIRRRLGRRALDAALIHVCAVIDANLHPTDVAGSLGGNDFALILLVANKELAHTKTQALIDAVKGQPFPWLEEIVSLEMVAGVATLEDVDTPENAIQAADKELIEGKEQAVASPEEPTAEDA
jgi:diguanylate cyclase (GGDEF)-like protein